jgi:hypothetical protein
VTAKGLVEIHIVELSECDEARHNKYQAGYLQPQCARLALDIDAEFTYVVPQFSGHVRCPIRWLSDGQN